MCGCDERLAGRCATQGVERNKTNSWEVAPRFRLSATRLDVGVTIPQTSIRCEHAHHSYIHSSIFRIYNSPLRPRPVAGKPFPNTLAWGL